MRSFTLIAVSVLFMILSFNLNSAEAAPGDVESPMKILQLQACSDDQCTALCNQVFPNRGCTGRCLSATECECTCH